MSSWREAGFDDSDGYKVRRWLISKINAVEVAMYKRMDERPTGLEEPAPDLDKLLQLDDPEMQRLADQRTKFRELLRGVDQGGSLDFIKAHAEWRKENPDEP